MALALSSRAVASATTTCEQTWRTSADGVDDASPERRYCKAEFGVVIFEAEGAVIRCVQQCGNDRARDDGRQTVPTK